jgi:uncharacterized membrane protein
MDNMVLSIFENDLQAEEVRRHLLAKEREGSIDLDDLVVVKKSGVGKLRFRHFTHLTLNGAVSGAFMGLLFGLLLLNPVFALAGLLIGLVVGGVSGALSHIGVDREFMRQELEAIPLGRTALCIMGRENTDKILEELKKFEGRILQTRVCTQTRYLQNCSIMKEADISMASSHNF